MQVGNAAKILIVTNQHGGHIISNNIIGEALAENGHTVYSVTDSIAVENFDKLHTKGIKTLIFDLPENYVPSHYIR